ncbi:MAG: hypothetical protein IMY72_12490 [Bacteroidetes bacterium]|nr:hypothetical protein [Bacteroidota bacterium]
MKKITLSIIALFFAGQMSFAQAVSEHAIIPVSVTLNSILRLNVVTGGNIEFVVNTIAQYTNGIANSSQYTTNFTVASSTDFDVTLMAEDATLFGSDNSAHTMLLNNIGYITVANAAAGGNDPANWALQAITSLTNTAAPIISGVVGASAGDVVKNNFDVQWELGTNGGGGMNAANLLTQSIEADRYVTNVFIDLVAK